MDTMSKWFLVLFGSVILFTGTLILGALVGVIPTDEGGIYLVPTLVIASLGLGMVCFIPFYFYPRAVLSKENHYEPI